MWSNQEDRNHAMHFFRNCFPQGIGSKEASSHYLDLDEQRQKLGATRTQKLPGGTLQSWDPVLKGGGAADTPGA